MKLLHLNTQKYSQFQNDPTQSTTLIFPTIDNTDWWKAEAQKFTALGEGFIFPPTIEYKVLKEHLQMDS